MKKCGYSFWGYLGDIKYDKKGNVASTPDGNAFYSWCIIRELQKRGYEVTQIMPDRDEVGYDKWHNSLFDSWCRLERAGAYLQTKKNIVDYESIDSILTSLRKTACIGVSILRDDLKSFIMTAFYKHLIEMEFILHEYRMWIPGRNDVDSILDENWQPDYIIQECLFEFCCETGKRLILFDLDYKLDFKTYMDLREKGCSVCVLELGTMWQKRYVDLVHGVETRQVYIPFDFDFINAFSLNRPRENNLVYVGNRYERDWCIDKYIADYIPKCVIYGNWLEGRRAEGTRKRWPTLRFGKRLQTADMFDVYSTSVSTILLAKEEYCQYGFMTARILESIFYGTVPLFIEEYGEKLIQQYAGDYADFLTVRSADDVVRRIEELKNKSGGTWINIIIEYLRDRLKFMDVKNFVDVLMEVK